MFEAGDWADEGAQPHLSALSLALLQSQTETAKPAKHKAKSDSKKDKKNREKSKSAKKPSLAKRLAVSVDNELDRMVNSPSATKRLLDDDSEEEDIEDGTRNKELKKKNKGKVSDKIKSTAAVVGEVGKKIGRSLSDSSIRESGYLLKLGEKFSSQEAFMRFVGLPGKKNKGLKRQRVESEPEQTPEPTTEDTSPDKSEIVQDKSEGEKENVLPIPPPRKKRKGDGLDVNKLRDLLAHEDQQSAKNIHKSLADEAREKLTASRFRYLNEQLYTQPSNAAVKLFSSDSTLFNAYHQGYQHQAKQWPLDPLDVIVTDILRQDSKAVIADLGCGEARLARSVPNPVHSLDLVAANDTVTVADIAHTPLGDASVDIVVFCLSLMGTNIKDFIFEAARILKPGGTLKIAELESRFQGEDTSVDKFIQSVEKYGFQNSWKDLKKDFFYFVDFKKVSEVKKKKKLPEIALKACLYKKR